MNDTEKYLFDVNGYIVVPDALPPELVARLNRQLDERIAAQTDQTARQHSFSHCLAWRGAMLSLIDTPRLEGYLDDLLGPPPYSRPERGPFFRLDHTYATVLMPHAEGGGAFILHGGNTPFDPGQFYRVSEGCIYNGLVVVAYNLTDVGDGDGGLGVVAGSHKANFRLPGEHTDLRQPNPLARAVCARAGSAVIFTEALSHGTLPWRGDHQRRTVFFKFNTYCSAFSGSYLDEQTRDWPELSEHQRAILEAPNARGANRTRRQLQAVV